MSKFIGKTGISYQKKQDITYNHPRYGDVDTIVIPMLDAFNDILNMTTCYSCSGHYVARGTIEFPLDNEDNDSDLVPRYVEKIRFLLLYLNRTIEKPCQSKTRPFIEIGFNPHCMRLQIKLKTHIFEKFDYAKFKEAWISSYYCKHNTGIIQEHMDDGYGTYILFDDIKIVSKWMNGKLDELSKEDLALIETYYPFIYAIAGQEV